MPSIMPPGAAYTNSDVAFTKIGYKGCAAVVDSCAVVGKEFYLFFTQWSIGCGFLLVINWIFNVKRLSYVLLYCKYIGWNCISITSTASNDQSFYDDSNFYCSNLPRITSFILITFVSVFVC